MQQHVHAPDTEHRRVEVVAVEGALVEPLAGPGVPVDALAVVFDEMLGSGDEEPGGAAGRIADHVLGGGRGHVHHQPDDVARRAELPVLPGGGDLAEHVFVEIALGVLVGHVEVVDLVDHVGHHPGRRHHEEGVLHVMGVGGSFARVPGPAQRLDEGKHLVAHRLEHPLRRKLLETRPAQTVLVRGEHRFQDRFAGAGGLPLPARVQLVQFLYEEQVRELLDDGERVRDAAGPHGVPDSVDLGLQRAGDHVSPPVPSCPRTAWTPRRDHSGHMPLAAASGNDGPFVHYCTKGDLPAAYAAYEGGHGAWDGGTPVSVENSDMRSEPPGT